MYRLLLLLQKLLVQHTLLNGCHNILRCLLRLSFQVLGQIKRLEDVGLTSAYSWLLLDDWLLRYLIA